MQEPQKRDSRKWENRLFVFISILFCFLIATLIFFQSPVKEFQTAVCKEKRTISTAYPPSTTYQYYLTDQNGTQMKIDRQLYEALPLPECE